MTKKLYLGDDFEFLELMSKLDRSVLGQNRKVRFGAVYSVDVLSIRTLHGKTTIPVLVVKQRIKINYNQNKMIDTEKLGKTEQTKSFIPIKSSADMEYVRGSPIFWNSNHDIIKIKTFDLELE